MPFIGHLVQAVFAVWGGLSVGEIVTLPHWATDAFKAGRFWSLRFARALGERLEGSKGFFADVVLNTFCIVFCNGLFNAEGF
ncbi:hypothetical protein PsAD2_00176 [Pseudovibrio axinellae]|uniref:Uncharacterized protein n=1 Tax=Pseudovibrio axinellae TaxID=989403 RepID=A0A166BDA2_9HYPH|nr:hypothetical protein PsAD2_00176 [Pseudovibrio axinellae]SEQ53314.1 hypothetical protein SAMN05421798_10323 [Pseudovibrio axinellae]